MTDLTETTLDTKRIHQGKVINLRVDTVRLPDGKVSTREVVEHRGAVAIVPMLDAETVILVRQFRTAANRVLLEIPAGSMNVGEEPDACVRREIVEETSYAAGEIERLFSAFVAPGYSQEVIHTYLATQLTPQPGKGDDDEFIDIVKMPLDEALDLIATGGIEDGKTIAGLLYVAMGPPILPHV